MPVVATNLTSMRYNLSLCELGHGSVFSMVGNMEDLIVCFAALPQSPDSLHQTISQSTISACPVVPTRYLRIKVGARPLAMANTLTGEVVRHFVQGV